MSKECLNALEMSKAEDKVTEFFNNADAVQAEEGAWYYSESSVNSELLSIYAELAKANERVKELENSFKQSIPIVDTLYALARNQLWIAYVWNDHNFPLNPEKYAKEAAESMGITNVDDANKLVEAFKQLRKEQE